jgi:hypothetical protein
MSKKIQVNFMAEDTLIEKAKMVAQVKGQSLSEMIREGLRLQMEDYDHVLDLVEDKKEQEVKLLQMLLNVIRTEILV